MIPDDPGPIWPPVQRPPVWFPAMLVVTAVVAAVLGFLVASGLAVCHAPASVWL